MKIEIRKTPQGTEYWDNIEKRSVFVPVGIEPGFEVTDNPKSMIAHIDLASDNDMTVTDGQIVENETFDFNDGELTDLKAMTVKELKQYASDKGIEIPKVIKKRDDIAQHLYDNWVPDSE